MNFVPTHTCTCLQMPFFHIRTYPMVNKLTHPHVQHAHMYMQAKKDLSCHSFLLKLDVPNFLSNCLYYYYDYFVCDMCGGVFMLRYVCTEVYRGQRTNLPESSPPSTVTWLPGFELRTSCLQGKPLYMWIHPAGHMILNLTSKKYSSFRIK